MPASPANVSGFAPAAMPRRIISASPRVRSPALPLSPKPSPSAAPAAMATTFLSAPASSTPRMSWLTYSRKRRRDRRADHAPGERRVGRGDDGRRGQPARDLGGQVRAGQGGDAPGRDRGSLGDDLAHPKERAALEALDHGRRCRPMAAGAERRPAMVVRRWVDGVAKMTRSVASATARGSAVARTVVGRSTPGSRASFRPVAAIRAARLRGVAQERDRLVPGDEPGQRGAPRAGPDDRDARPAPSAGPAGLSGAHAPSGLAPARRPACAAAA